MDHITDRLQSHKNVPTATRTLHREHTQTRNCKINAGIRHTYNTNKQNKCIDGRKICGIYHIPIQAGIHMHAYTSNPPF